MELFFFIFQVVERYSRDLPEWMQVNSTDGHISGVPQQSDIGTYELLIIGIGSNADSQEILCRFFPRTVIVYLDMNSLPIALGNWFEVNNTERLSPRTTSDGLSSCQLYSSIVIATMKIHHKQRQASIPFTTVANSLETILEIPVNLIQLLDSDSPALYSEQLRRKSVLHSEGGGNENSANHSFMLASWPVRCGVLQLSSADVHEIHRRAIPERLDLLLGSLQLTAGEFDLSLHKRKRRAVFFGSVTALEGTPVPTSVLPSLVLSSIISTATGSKIDGINSTTRDYYTSSKSVLQTSSSDKVYSSSSVDSISSSKALSTVDKLTLTVQSDSSVTGYKVSSLLSVQSTVSLSYTLATSTSIAETSVKANSSLSSRSSSKSTSFETSFSSTYGIASSSGNISPIYNSTASVRSSTEYRRNTSVLTSTSLVRPTTLESKSPSATDVISPYATTSYQSSHRQTTSAYSSIMPSGIKSDVSSVSRISSRSTFLPSLSQTGSSVYQPTSSFSSIWANKSSSKVTSSVLSTMLSITSSKVAQTSDLPSSNVAVQSSSSTVYLSTSSSPETSTTQSSFVPTIVSTRVIQPSFAISSSLLDSSASSKKFDRVKTVSIPASSLPGTSSAANFSSMASESHTLLFSSGSFSPSSSSNQKSSTGPPSPHSESNSISTSLSISLYSTARVSPSEKGSSISSSQSSFVSTSDTLTSSQQTFPDSSSSVSTQGTRFSSLLSSNIASNT